MVMDYINLFAVFGISYFALKIGKNFMRYIRYYSLSLSQQNVYDYRHDYDADCKEVFPPYNYSNSNLAIGKYYTLYLAFDSSISQTIKDAYAAKADEHNLHIENYLNSINQIYNKNKNCDNGIDTVDEIDSDCDLIEPCFDSGFDLICPQEIISKSGSLTVIDHLVKCCMKYNNNYVGYYLYSRSSTAVKTPLRFANNVGIIDSGYRGNIKVAFDNHSENIKEFKLESGNRYVQICPPNLEYPMKVVIVDDVSNLGKTSRDVGGFGSTGK
tara:strand:+ start:3565 stop:4374 length:810 start_codon:yes stop_codon:yes gene_type:complete